MPAATIVSPSLSLNLSCQLTQGNVSLQIASSPSVLLAASSTLGTFPSISVDQVVVIPFVVASSGSPYTFNCYSGIDPLGNVLHAVHLLALMVQNNSTTSANILTVGSGSHSCLGSDSFTVQRGGCVISQQFEGFAIASGSTDTITVNTAAGTNVAGQLTLFLRST